MAVCEFCGKEMNKADGCSVTHIVYKGKKYPRVKCGDKGDFLEGEKDGRCWDCNAKTGFYHHVFCDCEKCPICGEQLLSCIHSFYNGAMIDINSKSN